jgi:hypothetical protein
MKNILIIFFCTTVSMSVKSASYVEQTWVGHQVLQGERQFPIIGSKIAKTKNIMIAKVKIYENEIILSQNMCQVSFEKLYGVDIQMNSLSTQAIPVSHTTFYHNNANLTFEANKWEVKWGNEDLDLDDNPGITIELDSTFCSGKLFTSNYSSAEAFARFDKSGDFVGSIVNEVNQKYLGADSFCLRMSAGDTHEIQKGNFKYSQVEKNITCTQAIDLAQEFILD